MAQTGWEVATLQWQSLHSRLLRSPSFHQPCSQELIAGHWLKLKKNEQRLLLCAGRAREGHEVACGPGAHSVLEPPPRTTCKTPETGNMGIPRTARATEVGGAAGRRTVSADDLAVGQGTTWKASPLSPLQEAVFQA